MENVLIKKNNNQLPIADFQFQKKQSCKTMGKGVSIKRKGTGRNFSASIYYNSTSNLRTFSIALLALPISLSYEVRLQRVQMFYKI